MYKKNVIKTVARLVLLNAVTLVGQAITYTESYRLVVFTDRWMYMVVNAFAVLFNSGSPILNVLVTKHPLTNQINIY